MKRLPINVSAVMLKMQGDNKESNDDNLRG